ncbi:MAG: NAD(P)-dependent oxidoreductase [Candidatus Binatia bacterium]
MGDLVLVTGGAGYVGSHLTRKLLARGHRVRVLDNFVYGRQGLDEVGDHPGLELQTGDICDDRDLARALRGVDAVVALAAIVGDAACDLDPDRTMAINYASTRQLLAACQAAKVARLVFASSCSVYGANGDDLIHERSQLNPVSLYARTRIMSEEILLDQQDVDVIVLRLATVCGVSARMRFDLMVNTMTACATAQGAIRVSGAKQWRPHLHVQDAAEAFLLGVEAPSPREKIFNVGSDDQNYTVGEVAELVAKHHPGTRIEYAPNGHDLRSYRVTFDRIRTALGFQATRSVETAIAEVGGLMTSGRVADFRHDQFHNAKWLSATGRLQGAA